MKAKVIAGLMISLIVLAPITMLVVMYLAHPEFAAMMNSSLMAMEKALQRNYQRIKPNFVALRTHQETKQLLFAEGQTNIGIIGAGQSVQNDDNLIFINFSVPGVLQERIKYF